MTPELKTKVEELVNYWDKPAAEVADLLLPEIERVETRYRKLADALKYNKDTRTINPAAELERLEGLLGQVWDSCRDNNLSFRQRVVAVMTTIREKPVAKAENNDA